VPVPSPPAFSAFPSSNNSIFGSVCSESIPNTYYHNGSNALPVSGDDVYSDASGLNALAAGYYRMTSDFYIRVAAGGEVIEEAICGF